MQSGLVAWIDGTINISDNDGDALANLHAKGERADTDIFYVAPILRGVGLLMDTRTYLGKMVVIMAAANRLYVLATKTHLDIGRLYVCDIRDIQIAPVAPQEGSGNAQPSRLLRPN